MIYSLVKREFLSYFRTPIAYVFLAAFNLLVVGTTFFVGDLLETNQADLNPFFQILPWLLLVIVPGIGMRVWAQEKATGSIELLLTLPIKIWQPVVAKFLAGWLVMAIAIAITTPLIATISYLGNPDWGPLITGYLGGWLMAGAFLAVAGLCSACSKNQSSAFILAVGANFCMLIIGWGYFGDLLRTVLPEAVVAMLSEGSVILHYEALGRGVIELTDICYFLLIIATALMLNINLLEAGRINNKAGFRQQFGQLKLYRSSLFTFCIATALFIVSSHVEVRYDLTDSGAYSVSQQSASIVADLKKTVTANFYFSKNLKRMPPFINQYAKRVKAILGRLAKESDGKLQIKVINPLPDTEAADDAIASGIKPVDTRDGPMYLGVHFHTKGRNESIGFLNPSEEDLLEYNLAEALLRTVETKRPRIGIHTGIKMMASNNTAKGEEKRQWELLTQLSKNYELLFFPRIKKPLPNSLAALLIIHPQNISQSAIKQINNYLMTGGSIMVAVDSFSRTDVIQKYGQPTIPVGGSFPNVMSNLPKLFHTWGIGYNPLQVIGDRDRATQLSAASGNHVIYPPNIQLRKEDFANHPITQNLRQVLFAEGSWLTDQTPDSLEFIPLLSTSKATGKINATTLAFQNPKSASKRFKGSIGQKHLAALVQGRFPNAFSTENLADITNQLSLPTLSPHSKVMVIADIDFLQDRHTTTLKKAGRKTIRTIKNDNINLVLNGIDYLIGNKKLMAIRASGRISRPFTKLLDIQKNTEKSWRQKEAAISKKLNKIKKQIHSIYSQEMKTNTLSLSIPQLKLLKKIRNQKRLMESKFRNVRKNLRLDIQTINRKIMAFNFSLPLLLIMILAVLFPILRKQNIGIKNIIKPAPLFMAIGLLGLIIGISLIITTTAPIGLSAKAPAPTIFPMELLAKVRQVTIKNSGQEITLTKDSNNKWHSQKKEVNADRLARLLYDLAEARIVRHIENSNLKSVGVHEGKGIFLSGDKGFSLPILVGDRRSSGGHYVQVGNERKGMVIAHNFILKTALGFWEYDKD